MKKIQIIVFFLSSVCSSFGQTPEPPRLVVGIVVDQMRMEYLYRFESKFGEGGFKRLMGEGFTLANAHYNYVPTYTGPGHASIYTGATPAIHGIIGNEYYDKITRKTVNCVEDSVYKPVGSLTANGKISPSRLLSTTVTDELKISTQFRAKVVSMSIKDRGAVLPGGHHPDGAFWYDGKSGQFMTSTYYMMQVPSWVQSFNDRKMPDQFLLQVWKPLLPIEQYTESGPDESPYERRLVGKPSSAFPYILPELRARNGNYDLLSLTPFANDLLTEFALVAVRGEQMGADATPDFLCISYSTPDLIGHAAGPQSVEVEDTYLRLDRNIQQLLSALDKAVGVGKYTVFLTADHGVAEVPQYLKDKSMPGGLLSTEKLRADLVDFLKPYFPGRQLIANVSNEQVFFDQEGFSNDVKTAGVDLLIASQLTGNFLMTQEGVYNFYTESTLRQGSFSEGGIRGMVIRGFHPKRSGDIAYVLQPGWFSGSWPQGTTHQSPWTYDTHIPIIFFGAGIRKGSSAGYAAITDIAPTLALLLKTKFPSGMTGQPVIEALGEK